MQLGSYQELVPVGQFRIETIDGDVDDGPAVIVGQSLECIIIDDELTAPWRATGTAVGAITALILRSLPDAAVVALAADAAIGPRTYDIGDNPWEAIGEIAATIGAEVYCDAAGTFVIAELPDLLTATPAWTIAAGEHGVYLSATRGMSSKDVKNGVLVRGENPETGTATAPVLVVDNDPGSPTYWGGPFGRMAEVPHVADAYDDRGVHRRRDAAAARRRGAELDSEPQVAREPGARTGRRAAGRLPGRRGRPRAGGIFRDQPRRRRRLPDSGDQREGGGVK